MSISDYYLQDVAEGTLFLSSYPSLLPRINFHQDRSPTGVPYLTNIFNLGYQSNRNALKSKEVRPGEAKCFNYNRIIGHVSDQNYISFIDSFAGDSFIHLVTWVLGFIFISIMLKTRKVAHTLKGAHFKSIIRLGDQCESLCKLTLHKNV